MNLKEKIWNSLPEGHYDKKVVEFVIFETLKEVEIIKENVRKKLCYCNTLRPDKGDIEKCLYCKALNELKLENLKETTKT